jgi:copper chaperone CopZ
MIVKVPDMSCKHCEMRIIGALKTLPGIGDIAVDLDKKTVEITGNTDIKAITRAIEGAGYTVSQ